MLQASRVRTARVRSALLVSTAALGVAIATPALADDGPLSRADSSGPEAYASAGTIDAVKPDPYLASTYAPTPDIVIANPNTPTTAIDPTNITGVGQMVVDEQNGFIGLCTGTLINPRTVIFAAHCVNDRPQTAYGENSGGQPIAFGFGVNNNAAGNSAFGQWLNGTAGNKYTTSVARALYDVNYVAYNIASTEPNAAGFLYADIAVASLDTPAANIPTWAMLFSALPSTTITAATGSGYHVTIEGYGNNGTGTTGSSGGIDFRRRLAENLIGGLASLDQFENFIFGGASTTNPQNLYWIDFDDPRRGTASADPRDFNAWRDNAVASGKEGNTAPGDSGGPLILDQAYATKLVLGVLSGGYTRFFTGQPANGYGTAGFYQPLYLYWDYIAANNPYHYVSAVAGNADWTDPTHWITTLDPNYYVLNASGQLVNGIPTDPGAGKTGNTGTWGQACIEGPVNGGVSDCLDMKTGTETVVVKPIGTAAGVASDDRATVSIDSLGQGVSDDGSVGTVTAQQSVERVSASPQDVQGTQALPVATITNGLPGATNFVPNNDNGNRLTSTVPKYFEVNLNAAGTTTLSTTVTIDRFKITGAQAVLTVNAAGSLTSLIDVTHMTGIANVNGTINSVGDYLFVSGLITGTGRINAPFLTSSIGNFAPATQGTTGTLTIGGNLVLASGTTYAVDLGANGVSDRIAVVANGTSTGLANLGGNLLFNAAGGTTVLAGNTYTILTSAGGLSGTFATPGSLSAILRPTVTYTTNAVNVTLVAGTYASVVGTSPVQVAYAGLLDRNRGNPALAGIYATLDLQSAGVIQSQLDALAPRTETLRQSIGQSMLDSAARLYRDRVLDLNPGSLGGDVAYIGTPQQTAMRAAMPSIGGTLNSFAGAADDRGDTRVDEGKLPETMSAFFAGGYLDGDSAPMSTAIPAGGRDKYNGYFVAGGLEFEVGDNAAVGVSASYSDVDGDTAFGNQTANGTLLQGTVYGKAGLGTSGVFVDGVLSAGRFKARTSRNALIVNTNYTLTSEDDLVALSGEIGVGKMFGSTFQVGPRAAIRASTINFGPVIETGGLPALTIQRERVSSVQARGSLEFRGTGEIRPFGSVAVVHDFETRPALFGANFVGGTGANATFALTGTDQNWAEISGGLALEYGNVEISVSADTTIERKDLTNRSYRGAIKVRF